MADTIPSDAIGRLRECFANLKASPTYGEKVVGPRDGVLARFQPIFMPEHIPHLSKEEFCSFLIDKNNQHWSGLHRQSTRLCADMHLLRKTIAFLLDESVPVDKRLDKVLGSIKGLGKGITTAILFVAHPDQYGVWNNTSESGMIELGLWPEFARGESFGRKYFRVNQTLLQVRDALQTDLWTLDYVWWWVLIPSGTAPGPQLDAYLAPVIGSEAISEQSFALERHLHEFLRDNWERLDIGREWTIYSPDGEEELGYEYFCRGVGRIDILAKHKKQPKWLVIELKRNLASDQAVGQALKYMGWVQKNLAKAGEEVRGLIISHEADDSIRYAVDAVPAMDLRLYEVSFRLKKAEV